MNEDSYAAAVKLVSSTYVEQGKNAHRTQQNFVRELLEKVRGSHFLVIHNPRMHPYTEKDPGGRLAGQQDRDVAGRTVDDG